MPPAHPLLAPIAPPKGMRASTLELIAKVARGTLARDVLFLAPIGAVDRRLRVKIAEAEAETIVVIEAEIDAHIAGGSPKAPYRIRLRDETGFLTVAYFRPNVDMLKRMYPVGQTRLLSGKVEFYGGERQMLHPDYVVDPAKGEAPPPVEPVYPLTAGLPLRAVQRTIAAALPVLEGLPEWLSSGAAQARGWLGFGESLKRLHQPQEPVDVLPEGPFRSRLAFDELFARQCALRLRRAVRRQKAGLAMAPSGALAQKLLASAPFAPTGAQKRAFAEIAADLAAPSPMLRLLQGDVGSGKTFVAALAMAQAAEAGFQSALMAPTEILARQHGASILPLLEAAGIRAAVLTGRDKGKERRQMLAALESGYLHALIGTHALFQDEVAFNRLGFVIIDEQHRFGVGDRAKLVAKGAEPHVLVMSATPIPRTLALSLHGDMELSVLDEKPPGRKPIITRAMSAERIEDLLARIKEAAGRGERAYWVCPLVEESELVDLANVEERWRELNARLGEGVELVHGKMPPAAREAAMERFKSGAAFLLVATTVIEVGVNVPEATIMIIEDSDRFGLAQLHQLRGRVGRGDKGGFCILLWRPPLGETAKERLDALRRTEDGFVIAELDYKMRGAGDVLGVRQSGLPPFRFVAPAVHGPLLEQADAEARLAIDQDPELASPRGNAIRLALALFDCDAGEGRIRSG